MVLEAGQEMDVNREALLPFAAKYVWWKTAEDAVAYPQKSDRPSHEYWRVR